jgi:DNA-binding NarL/FixJ family response regulator
LVSAEMKDPFYFLEHLINILLIDDDSFFADMIMELLEPVSMINVSCVSSSLKAEKLILSGKRFHLCVLDLGISDIAHDEFYIIRRFAHVCPVIVLTGSSSPVKGATSILLGAKIVMEKGRNFSSRLFYDTLMKYILINIVHRQYNESSTDTVNFATKVLIEKKPVTATQWAEYLRITDRQLRNLWPNDLGLSVKHILQVYYLFYSAFKYYETQLFSDSITNTKEKCIDINKTRAFFEQYNSCILNLLS